MSSQNGNRNKNNSILPHFYFNNILKILVLLALRRVETILKVLIMVEECFYQVDNFKVVATDFRIIYFFRNKLNVTKKKGGEKMDQNNMREKLNQIINKYGTTITFIAKKTQLSKTTISLFLRNERDLKTEEIQSRVIKFIEQRI